MASRMVRKQPSIAVEPTVWHAPMVRGVEPARTASVHFVDRVRVRTRPDAMMKSPMGMRPAKTVVAQIVNPAARVSSVMLTEIA